MSRQARVLSVMAILGVSGAAIALPYDPTTFAGTFDTTKSTSVARGPGPAILNGVRVFVPWLLPYTDGSQNSSVVGVDANGQIRGAVTTFSANPPPVGTVRVIAAVGSTDAAWPVAGGSVNVFVNEGANPLSNSLGTLLADGTTLWRANFSTLVQNNLEYQTLPSNVNTNPAPSAGTNKVFSNAFPGIDDNPVGSVFLGVPSADRFGPNNALYTAVTMFDGGTAACPSGTAVYINNNNNPNAPFCQWLQAATPIPSNALVSETRQTQPMIKNVVVQTGCTNTLYTTFGVGFSPATGSTTPYSGGSARPLYLIVSPTQSATNGYTLPYVVIRADGGSGVGPANTALRFVSAQATGGGSGPFTGGMFDMNSKGQIVVVREDRSGSVTIYQVLRYDPIIQNCQIVGYNQPVVIAQNGQDGVVTELLNTIYVSGTTPVVVTTSLVPFSGVSIDDDGNVAYVGTTEKFDEVRTVSGTGASGTGPVLFSTTNTLFFYEAPRNTLHRVIAGGQNGDILNNINAGGPQLSLGFFPVDTSSDSFTRAGLAKSGRVLSLTFRNCNQENGVLVSGTAPSVGFTIRGGLLRPGVSGQEASVRGVVQVRLRPFCAGDFTGDGVVNFGDLSVVLGGFGTTYNFSNLSAVLAAFGTNCPQ